MSRWNPFKPDQPSISHTWTVFDTLFQSSGPRGEYEVVYHFGINVLPSGNVLLGLFDCFILIDHILDALFSIG